MIVFDRLWETMQQKGITQYKLIHTYGISPAQITRLKRNANINTHTLNMLCEILDCKLEDISEYRKNVDNSTSLQISSHQYEAFASKPLNQKRNIEISGARSNPFL